MSFSVDISNFAKKCAGNADTVVRKTVIDIGTRLVERTPVGDAQYWKSKPPPGYVGGHARANWSHSEGAPVIKEFKAIDGSDGKDNISARRIERTIHRSGGSKNAAGKVHFIQNSVPYIERLEDGYSGQAPNGMVALTATEFQGLVDAIAGGLK